MLQCMLHSLIYYFVIEVSFRYHGIYLGCLKANDLTTATVNLEIIQQRFTYELETACMTPSLQSPYMTTHSLSQVDSHSVHQCSISHQV